MRPINFTFINCVPAIAALLFAALPATADEPEGTEAEKCGSGSFLIPHDDLGHGDNASETVAAATRLHGIKDSFNPDRFISHILYVTGIVDRDMFSPKSWSTSLTRRLSRKGLLRRNMTPRPGDLVFFSLSPAAPHSARASKVSVGVVEKVKKGSVQFLLAGSERVIRGTLKTPKGKVSETKLISCKAQTAKPARTKTKKATKSKTAKAAKSGKNAGGTSKSVPCRASELLIGFADIDEVALELNPLPPSPPVIPDAKTESASQTP